FRTPLSRLCTQETQSIHSNWRDYAIFRAALSPSNTAHVLTGRERLVMLRRINLSAAIIVLVCFFLPWVQVSCAGAKDSLSGLDLARQDDALLWLIPLVICGVLVFILMRMRAARSQ